MARLFPFRKLRTNKAFRFRRKGPVPWPVLLAAVIILLAAQKLENPGTAAPLKIQNAENLISCSNPYISDGDTLRCNGYRIRLAGIDAPELPGHCREGRKCTPGDPQAARDYLRSVSRGTITCAPLEKDVYGRTVAHCSSGGNDLSCVMIQSGHAIRRYGDIFC